MFKQKITSRIFLLIFSALLLTGCVISPPIPENNAAPRGTDLLGEILTATLIPTDDPEAATATATPEGLVETMVFETLSAEMAQTEAPAADSATATPEASPTLHIITPTLNPLELTAAAETGEPQETTEAGEDGEAETTPEAGETGEDEETEGTPEPSSTPVPQPTIDGYQINPELEFTGAHRVDTMDEPSLWWDESGKLPNSQYIQMEMADGVMSVTGKPVLWDTWWISGHVLYDFYIEMEVNSGDCIDTDTYGMILRASQHSEPSRGYLVGFTCDGKVLVKRLESASPYVAISILNPTETNLIYAGANQTNILGVAFDGSSISIYPNRYYFTTIQDTGFSYGRYGIFVSAGDDGNYTFMIDEIRSWEIISTEE